MSPWRDLPGATGLAYKITCVEVFTQNKVNLVAFHKYEIAITRLMTIGQKYKEDRSTRIR